MRQFIRISKKVLNACSTIINSKCGVAVIVPNVDRSASIFCHVQ